MLITVQEWIFSVDTEITSAFSSNKLADQCQCGYCRNFCAAINKTFPELRTFLADFGVYVEAPDELMPFEPTLYAATFCISGTILQHGASFIKIGDLEIRTW